MRTKLASVSRMWRAMITVALITSAASCLLSAVLFRATFDHRLDNTLKREKVCTQKHQGAPCRALLDRLWSNMSDEQKRRVACGALWVLHDVHTDRIYIRACGP